MLFSEVFLVVGQALDLGSCCGRSKKIVTFSMKLPLK